MTVEIKYNFDTGSDYTFDTSVVEVTGGEARLKLANNAGQTFNQDFVSDSGFIYDPGAVQFSAGLLEQLAQNPTDSILGCNYNTDINANWNLDGSKTPSVTGTATVSAGKLDCTGNSNAGVYYSKNRTTSGAVKLKYTANYTGSPPQNVNIVSLSLNTTDADELVFFNSPSGNNLRVTVRNDVGGIQAAAITIGGYSPTIGVEDELEFNYDSTTGDVNAYVNGTRIGAVNVGAWTRGTGSGRCYVGAYIGNYDACDGSFDDVIVFDTVQHTGVSYTPGYSVISNIYEESTVTLPTFIYSDEGVIQTFESISQIGSSTVYWILNGHYWDGGAWVISDNSYAQANDISTINANIGSSQVSSSIVMKLVFPSSETQNSTNDFTFNYTGQQYVSDSTILPNATIPVTVISEFIEEITAPINTEIKYTIEINASQYWFNGGSWVVSSSVAETNDATTINANLLTLPIALTGDFIRPKVFFITDGSATPAVQTLCLKVLYDVNPVDAPDTTIIFGSLRDMVAEEMSGTASLRIVNDDQFFISSNSIQPGSENAIANDEGIAAISGIISTASINYKYSFYIDYTDSNGKQQTKYLGKSIAPDDTASNIANLTFEI